MQDLSPPLLSQWENLIWKQWWKEQSGFIKVMLSPSLHISLQGWFSPGQVFVLDEYCARYGVRGCHRHLCYLNELMEHSENGAVIDPTLLHYSFAFCASHVHGNRYFFICSLAADVIRLCDEGKQAMCLDWASPTCLLCGEGMNIKSSVCSE